MAQTLNAPLQQHGFIIKDDSWNQTGDASTTTIAIPQDDDAQAVNTTTNDSNIDTSAALWRDGSSTPVAVNEAPRSGLDFTSASTSTFTSTTSVHPPLHSASLLHQSALSSLSPAPSPGLPWAGLLRPAEYAHLTPGAKKMMRNVIRGLKSYQDPEAAIEGFGGTYFFRDEGGKRVAIMKPCDEEPLAPNNPKGFVGRFLGDPGLKPTVRVGEAASREVAAYLLDKDGFARVPHTVMVEMAHPIFHYQSNNKSGGGGHNNHHSDCDCPDQINNNNNKIEMATGAGGSEMELQNLQAKLKVGSLQEFVPHACDTSELGASRFSAADVQRIGILDIRLFNTDRHAGNILVQKVPSSSGHHQDHHHHGGHSFLGTDSYKLVPIDHGFALPEALEPPYFEWQHWPQAMLPFGKEELAYIGALDADADVAMLRAELPTLREESLRLLQVTTGLLKKCATAGLSLNEIANVVTRPLIGLDEEPSELEKICFAALDQVESMAASSSSHVEEEEDELTDLEEGDEDDDVEEEEDEEEEEMKEEQEDDVITKRDSTTSPTKPCQAIAAHAHRRDTPCVSPSSSLSPSSSTETPVSIKGVATTTVDTATTTTTTRRRMVMLADDQLFSMDDEFTTTTTSSKSPPAIGSPVGVSLKKIRTANDTKGCCDASLAGSIDSMSIREGDEDSPLSSTATPVATTTLTTTTARGGGGSSIMTPGASMENAKRSAFAGLPSTYVAGGGFVGVPRRAGSATTDGSSSSSGSKTGGEGNANKPRRRRRIAAGGGTRMGKVRAQAYPPLVESRAASTTAAATGGSNGGATSAANANAIFSGFSEEAWKVFLQLVCDSIDAAITAGTWKQASPSKQAQMMSCPRF